MTDDDPTGPWALAIGVLAIGVGAVVREVLRRRDDENRDRGGAT